MRRRGRVCGPIRCRSLELCALGAKLSRSTTEADESGAYFATLYAHMGAQLLDPHNDIARAETAFRSSLAIDPARRPSVRRALC